jgi:heme a synthase
LITVVLGLPLILFCWKALQLRRWRRLRYLSLLAGAAAFLVLFESWLGSRVVATNLKQGIVTVHMVVAIAIACLVIWALQAERLRTLAPFLQKPKTLRTLALAAFALTLVQLAFGTQLRELVDVTSQNLTTPDRSTWLDRSSVQFLVHRTFSWVVGGSIIALCVVLLRTLGTQHPRWGRLAVCLLSLLGIEIAMGVVMVYNDMPAIVQPVHLLAAALLCGLLFFTMLVAWRAKPATT